MVDAKLKKLKEQRDAINARIRKAEAQVSGKERRKENRRKILAGAYALTRAAKDSAFAQHFMSGLDSYLTRADDRVLFGLPPRSQAPEKQPVAARA